ncbi:MAG: 16S rRNA (adenine(1518)-N(6)/adenine(1519)-N(6))-dimethyltransferase RsmA [Microthrixaceae bacterium]
MLDAAAVNRMLAGRPGGARRSLGQNFVTDPGVIDDLVAAAGIGPASRVLEVGPGLGSLTLGLLAAGAEVVALEKDPELLAMLRDAPGVRGAQGLRLVQGDATEVDWQELLDGGSWQMVSNLPYNVAVPIVLGVLAGAPMVGALWSMVQLEVAERLCAGPGGRSIGVPTIKAAWYAQARMAMRVPPGAFTPRPRVHSAVVEMQRRPPPRDDVDPGEVFGLVEAGYRQRRKMLRSSLGGLAAPEVFELAGIEATSRPEELGVSQWADLAAARHGIAPVAGSSRR